MTAPARDFDPVTLRLFVAVCEEGNIARAAERQALVASAVSKRIAALEQAVGAPLLVRGRRGVQPTAAGTVLLRQAREVLRSMERLHAELSGFAAGVHGSVRVVASVSALAERLPEDIAGFLARYQSVRVALDERVSPEIARSVREGAADLGVLWDVAALDGLQLVPYRSDRLAVALPPRHALSGARTLRFEQTLDFESIGVAPGGTMEVILRRAAGRLGRTLAPRIEVSGLDAACRIVAAGLGLAVLPLEAAAPLAAAGGLELVPLADPWALRRFVVCTRDGASLPAAARLLVEHLAREAAAG